jgi:predicted nucleic acid-binding protein
VFDTSVLSAFAEAEQLDVLGYYLSDHECFATDVVRDEIRVGAQNRPALKKVDSSDWLERGALDDDAGLRALARWVELIGAGEHDYGEASVFAFAELHGSVSVIDDREATDIGRREKLEVHGSLWMIGGFCRAGKLTEYAASRMIDALREVGARLPCTGNGFPTWARKQGLL